MKWIPGKFLSGQVLRSLVFWFLLLTLIVGTSACTFPSDNYYSRMEDKAENMLNIARKNEANNYSTAKNTGDAISKKELEIARKAIPDPMQIPKDQNTGSLIETLLYILLGISGLGGMAKGANFLYKVKPKV